MSTRYDPLIPAEPAFDEHGVAVSRRFGDVYHSRSGALAQARGVFLAGNQLPARWRGRSAFTVCETGFGLGNNFLALWQAWRDDPQRPARLHVVSFEAHPFRRDDLRALLSHQHEGAVLGLARQLSDAWPPLTPGLHRLDFEQGAVTLTLAFGPITRTASQIQAGVDAFFLDGFAPRLNPDMWSPALFGQLVRMANAEATAATWCCAGQVRRDLRAAGFVVEKVPGFGTKREMTVARLRAEISVRRTPAAQTQRRAVLVVGGGLAGAGIAQALARRGHRVTVLDPAFAGGLAATHQGHRAMALSPLVSIDDNIRARVSRAGVLRALHRWQGLPASASPQVCGTLLPAATDADALAQQGVVQTLQFTEQWVQWLDAAQASALAGIELPRGATYLPSGQVVYPEPLLNALLGWSGIRCIPKSVAALRRLADGTWLAYDAGGAVLAEGADVVLAAARGAGALLAGVQGLPGPMLALSRVRAMDAVAGQVSHYRAGTLPTSAVILSGEGYLLPPHDGVQVAGSTYVRGAHAAVETPAGRREIARKLETLLDGSAGRRLADVAVAGGWAGWRVAAPDRLPIIGPLSADVGLWLACGYGSRGLTWSALAGELMGASLDGEPAPLERNLLAKMAPR